MSEQRYARLQGLRVGVSVKQSDYVYVPDNILLVKKIEDIGDTFDDLLGHLYANYTKLGMEGRIYLWDGDGETHIITIDSQGTKAHIVTSQGVVYRVNLDEEYYEVFQYVENIGEFDNQEDFINGSTNAQNHVVRGEIEGKAVIRVGDYFLGGDFGLGILDGNSIGRVIDVIEEDIDELEIEIAKIKDGTTVVKKAEFAEKDKSGRVIEDTYVKDSNAYYAYATNEVVIQLRNAIEEVISTNRITITKATQTYDGLLSKEDKNKLDNLFTTILAEINTHDTDQTSHLYLRQLIAGLQSEIDRLDGKGKSHGMIDKTQSELVALGEVGRNSHILAFLQNKYVGYTLAMGDLIYTLTVSGQNEHEWEYNGTTWVDNGAWTIEKASNTEYGLVKGDDDYVRIISGIIEVLKANTAIKLGDELDYFTKAMLDGELANRYTKPEIDNLLDQLKAIYGWEDSVLYNFKGEDKTIPLAEFADYSFLIITAYDGGEANTDSKIIPLSTIDVYSWSSFEMYGSSSTQIGSVQVIPDGNDDSILYLDFNATRFPDARYVITGIKLFGMNSNLIPYDDWSVGEMLGYLNDNKADQVDLDVVESDVAKLKVDTTKAQMGVDKLEATINKIDLGLDVDTVSGEDILSLGADVLATNGEVLVEGVSLYAKQLVTNGDFSDGGSGWTNAYSTGTVTNGVYINTGDGTNKKPLVARTISNNTSDKIYITTGARVTNSSCSNIIVNLASSYEAIVTPTINIWYHISKIMTPIYANDIISAQHEYADNNEANGKVMEVKYIYTFNISTLVANKQYSPLYNKTFDNMTDPEIKAQMDKWVQEGTLPNDTIQSVGGSKRVKSVGKNLLEYIEEGNIENATGLDLPSDSHYRTNYIKVKSGATYRTSNVTMGRVFFYDKDKNHISNDGIVTFLIPANVKFIRYHIAKSDYVNNWQIEESPTATTYTPYVSNDLYLEGLPLNRLPNGVKDTIECRNGKYYYVQRVGEYTISSLTSNNGTHITRAYYGALSGHGINTTNNQQGLIKGFKRLNDSVTWDVVGNEGNYYFGTNGYVYLLLPLGTTSQQATDLYSGTKVLYQLATPVETEITSIGTLLPQPNGTVYITNEVADVTIYTDKISVDHDITNLTELYLLNNDGTKTKLDGAVVNGNEITHSSLTEGDLVFVSYEYQALDGYNTITYKKDNIARKSEIIDAYDKTATDTLLDEKTDQTYTDDQLLLKQDKIIDTGWQSISLEAGVTGSMAVRKVGVTINLIASIKSNTHNMIVANLPVGYRPPTGKAPFSSSVGINVLSYIKSTGELTLGTKDVTTDINMTYFE